VSLWTRQTPWYSLLAGIFFPCTGFAFPREVPNVLLKNLRLGRLSSSSCLDHLSLWRPARPPSDSVCYGEPLVRRRPRLSRWQGSIRGHGNLQHRAHGGYSLASELGCRIGADLEWCCNLRFRERCRFGRRERSCAVCGGCVRHVCRCSVGYTRPQPARRLWIRQ